MNKLCLLNVALVALCCNVGPSFSGEVLEGYKYDALGRLTQVSENNNVKTGYCYDKAGNRKVVSSGAGAGNDCDPEDERLAAPTGLTVEAPWGAAWVVSWTPSKGAAYYKLNFGGQIVRIKGGAQVNIRIITIRKSLERLRLVILLSAVKGLVFK